ncbi:ribonuclease H-like domain-containing protein [Immersiella caudata]|uniref:Ribonuclease H-like domain-containing protein n=1 Tax=Immersiella caudata TaxID=314043 RepID=A0AA39THF8_9PEZI|nr:ribonuclease H-like domain-containing protein [Immersiella caudata]
MALRGVKLAEVARRLPLRHVNRSQIRMPVLREASDKEQFVARLANYVHPIDTLRTNHYRHLSPNWTTAQYPVEQFAPTPPSFDRRHARAVVAIDCEMVNVAALPPGTLGTRQEVGRLSAIDVLTGETLVDALVDPDVPVLRWNTKCSGISRRALQEAKSWGVHLHGWEGARTALWNHMSDGTILIGHALKNDLPLLRMWHTKVIDTAILTKMAMSPHLTEEWSLQKLSLSFLNRTIQAEGPHCSTVDALAAADIVKVIVENPGLLERWAKDADELIRDRNALRDINAVRHIFGFPRIPPGQYDPEESDKRPFRNLSERPRILRPKDIPERRWNPGMPGNSPSLETAPLALEGAQ